MSPSGNGELFAARIQKNLKCFSALSCFSTNVYDGLLFLLQYLQVFFSLKNYRRAKNTVLKVFS